MSELQQTKSIDFMDDPLEKWLMLATSQDRLDCVENAREMIRKVQEYYPTLSAFFAQAFEMVFFMDDMDYIHFIFFIMIPNIEPIYKDLQKMCHPLRMARFVRKLTYCRHNLIDGLTREQTEVKRASQAHYKTLREFVEEMRDFYLLDSHSLRDDRRVTDDQVAQWNRVDAYEYPAVGSQYLNLMARFVSVHIHEEYTSHVRTFQPSYGSDTDAVQTRMILIWSATDEQGRPNPVKLPAGFFKTVKQVYRMQFFLRNVPLVETIVTTTATAATATISGSVRDVRDVKKPQKPQRQLIVNAPLVRHLT